MRGDDLGGLPFPGDEEGEEEAGVALSRYAQTEAVKALEEAARILQAEGPGNGG